MKKSLFSKDPIEEENTLKKEFKTPKSSTNIICLPRQGKFRRYDLPSDWRDAGQEI